MTSDVVTPQVARSTDHVGFGTSLPPMSAHTVEDPLPKPGLDPISAAGGFEDVGAGAIFERRIR
jgi:hypothetical protein